MITIITLICLFFIIEFKFKPRFSLINNNKSKRIIVWYYIKSKYNNIKPREFFTLIKINKKTRK